eukprot:TRINITY_DN6704_c0_g1_i1.p1 TRINITY_DN6704_c0_g1~~TRINITY_DN6704_c0_g1_i1.p1  ORF type:complete len:290 (+),score=76.09 TRINITY_DN6704_c0_g1_i1:76-945(+)
MSSNKVLGKRKRKEVYTVKNSKNNKNENENEVGKGKNVSDKIVVLKKAKLNDNNERKVYQYQKQKKKYYNGYNNRNAERIVEEKLKKKNRKILQKQLQLAKQRKEQRENKHIKKSNNNKILENTSKKYGVSTKVLEQIKKRQQQRELRDKLYAEDHYKKILTQLPIICKHLRTFYRMEKKTTLNLMVVINKLQNSMSLSMKDSSITKKDIEESIRVLARLFPDYSSMIKIGNKQFLKINLKIPYSILQKSINQKIRTIILDINKKNINDDDDDEEQEEDNNNNNNNNNK